MIVWRHRCIHHQISWSLLGDNGRRFFGGFRSLTFDQLKTDGSTPGSKVHR
ncbi:hypothetical protein DPMN_133303 [Dreissena polymorpha]|uniref:Uncharacterized protein n=1 Tax=Dreissena polymorpha TaxID=45954 RepID=A0A9D4J9N1_DREPO|nr:hypothetical protein DPMN_133303 [Dreissena polymorpha]